MLLSFLVFLLAAFVGSSNPVFIRFATVEIPPLTFSAIRFLLATLIMFVLWQKEKQIIAKKDLYKVLPYTFNMILYVIAIQYTSLTMAGIFYTFAPILTAFLGYFLLKEKVAKVQVIGLILALFGVGILLHGSIETSDLFSYGKPIGNILILCAVCIWGFYPVGARSLSKSYSTNTILFYTFLITTLLVLVILPIEWFIRPLIIANISQITFISAFGSGVIGTVIFYFCYQWFIKHTSAFTGSFISYGGFISSTFYGAFFFHEHLTPKLVSGVLFIMLGVFLATSYTQLKKRA